ncbi:NUDIX hydrolase [Streptomyces sp. NPDC002671]
MDHTPEAAYANLRNTHPHWFRTPQGDGAISIMHPTISHGRVIHRDQWWTLLQDPVVFPDGQEGRYLRMLSPQSEPGVAVLPVVDTDVVLIEQFRHATRTWHLEIPRGGGATALADEENVAKEIREEIGARVGEVTALGVVHPDTGILGQAVRLFAARIDTVGRVGRAEGIRRARRVTFALFRARLAGLAVPLTEPSHVPLPSDPTAVPMCDWLRWLSPRNAPRAAASPCAGHAICHQLVEIVVTGPGWSRESSPPSRQLADPSGCASSGR